jgi:hypothetical protein
MGVVLMSKLHAQDCRFGDARLSKTVHPGTDGFTRRRRCARCRLMVVVVDLTGPV